MVTVGNHSSDKVKDRISCEQFVKAGREVLKLLSESDQHKYYFRLFAQGKEHLTQDGNILHCDIFYRFQELFNYVKQSEKMSFT